MIPLNLLVQVAMFSRKSNSTPIKTSQNESSCPPSIISEDFHVTGNIISKGEVHIDGMLDGDIKCQILVVGQPGKIRGEIIAETLKVHGTIEGEIKAKAIFLAATARVVGDILHESLEVESGAHVEGHCRRFDNKKDKPIGIVSSNDPQPPQLELVKAKTA